MEGNIFCFVECNCYESVESTIWGMQYLVIKMLMDPNIFLWNEFVFFEKSCGMDCFQWKILELYILLLKFYGMLTFFTEYFVNSFKNIYIENLSRCGT